jgi:iron complex transport system permease protein
VKPRRPGSRAALIGAAAAFVVAAALVSVFVGAANLNPIAVATALAGKIPFLGVHSGLSALDSAVLFQIRLPRIVLGALVGGLLAVAGAGYQGVFRNPLVDSGMLGASAGAGLGATIAIIYGHGTVDTYDLVPLIAFAGGSIAVVGTYVLGR